MKGFYSSFKKHYFTVSIDYCNQTVLSSIMPGHTCRPRAEAEKLLAKGIDVHLLTLTSYFDQKNFEGEPI